MKQTKKEKRSFWGDSYSACIAAININTRHFEKAADVSVISDVSCKCQDCGVSPSESRAAIFNNSDVPTPATPFYQAQCSAATVCVFAPVSVLFDGFVRCTTADWLFLFLFFLSCSIRKPHRAFTITVTLHSHNAAVFLSDQLIAVNCIHLLALVWISP